MGLITEIGGIVGNAIVMLKSHAELKSIVGDRIYNNVPQDTVYPYIKATSGSIAVLGDKSEQVFSQILSFNCWSEHHGDKECFEIMDYINCILTNKTIISGQDVSTICLNIESIDTFIEQNGNIHHSVLKMKHIFS